MKYVAKKLHKDPCALCGDSIVPGDAVVWWCYTNEDGPGSGSGYGGIVRVHATCDKIGSREDCYDESLTPFEAKDEDRHQNHAEEKEHALAEEAEAALAAWRSAHPNAEAQLDDALRRLAALRPYAKHDAGCGFKILHPQENACTCGLTEALR